MILPDNLPYISIRGFALAISVGDKEIQKALISSWPQHPHLYKFHAHVHIPIPQIPFSLQAKKYLLLSVQLS